MLTIKTMNKLDDLVFALTESMLKDVESFKIINAEHLDALAKLISVTTSKDVTRTAYPTINVSVCKDVDVDSVVKKITQTLENGVNEYYNGL
ncbi:hypothetical protein ACFQ3W_23400 [Paenibacillus puldeungensis]|uniref:Uncharacterized protein n=1 Tax=Paenibacillus puldeungensis TaxID=696536 RepID=A0ABW3S3R6_9BACL